LSCHFNTLSLLQTDIGTKGAEQFINQMSEAFLSDLTKQHSRKGYEMRIMIKNQKKYFQELFSLPNNSRLKVVIFKNIQSTNFDCSNALFDSAYIWHWQKFLITDPTVGNSTYLYHWCMCTYLSYTLSYTHEYNIVLTVFAPMLIRTLQYRGHFIVHLM
jgi:hypothetical protein